MKAGFAIPSFKKKNPNSPSNFRLDFSFRAILSDIRKRSNNDDLKRVQNLIYASNKFISLQYKPMQLIRFSLF